MQILTKVLIVGWVLEAFGLIYMLSIPVGEASEWVLLATALIGFPLLFHFVVFALKLRIETNPKLKRLPRRFKSHVKGLSDF